MESKRRATTGSSSLAYGVTRQRGTIVNHPRQMINARSVLAVVGQAVGRTRKMRNYTRYGRPIDIVECMSSDTTWPMYPPRDATASFENSTKTLQCPSARDAD